MSGAAKEWVVFAGTVGHGPTGQSRHAGQEYVNNHGVRMRITRIVPYRLPENTLDFERIFASPADAKLEAPR